MPDSEVTVPEWVTKEPCYITLVANDPDAVVTTLLIERSMERIPRTSLYKPVAIVLTFGEGYIAVNGLLLPPTDGGTLETDLCNLADEARFYVPVGQGYYSDPDAS